MLSHILLVCSVWDNLPTALALCLIPFLLGWLAARTYYKIGSLRDQVAELTGRVSSLTGDLTENRVRLTQAEADIDAKTGQVRKAKDDLIMCENERNALREQAANAAAGVSGGSSKKAALAAPAATAAAAVSSIMFADKKWKSDDLKIVEGIESKIEVLLHNAGIKTWKDLSKTAANDLNDILDAAGSDYNMHDPGTWPEQAGLADKGKWDELKTLQDNLKAGKA